MLDFSGRMWDDAWENIVVFLPPWYDVDTEILLKGEYGMKGSVRLKGKTWSYRIDLGKVDGKRKQVEKSGYKTEREAVKAMNDVIYHYNRTGEYLENQRFTFQQNYEQFIKEEAPATRAYATIQKYESMYRNHLKEEFGPSYLYQISPNRIREFLNTKSQEYSAEYLKSLYKALNVLFAYAYRNKRMKVNPMDEVDAPPDPRHVKEYHYLSREERQKIQKRIVSTNVQVAYYLALNTGVRVSECFALRWSDVDFSNRKVRINKQLRYEDRKWCFTPLKTTNSYRDVNVTPTFIRYLQEVKRYQEEAQAFYGDGYCPGNVLWDRRGKNQDERMVVRDLINVKQNGAMLTPNSEKFLAKIIREDCGIPFKFHNLRHTYATILAENGAHPRYVQQQLGHSKFEFTLRYYTHVTAKMGEQAMGLLETELELPSVFGEVPHQFSSREGILVPDDGFNHVRIRYPDNSFSDALRQGTQLEIWNNGSWVCSRLNHQGNKWIFENVESPSIYGMKVRLLSADDPVPGFE